MPILHTRRGKLVAKTNKRLLLDLFPITTARDAIPRWFKEAPVTKEISSSCPVRKSVTNLMATIRGCFGVSDILRRGFIEPAWCDMSIVVYPDGTFSSVFPTGSGFHADAHAPSSAPPDYQGRAVIKLVSPWALFGDDTHYLAIAPTYHSTIGVEHMVPPGTLEFKYQHALNVFILAKPREEPYEIFIKAGEPLLHLIPLTTKRIALSTAFDSELFKDGSLGYFLTNQYRRFKKLMEGKNG